MKALESLKYKIKGSMGIFGIILVAGIDIYLFIEHINIWLWKNVICLSIGSGMMFVKYCENSANNQMFAQAKRIQD